MPRKSRPIPEINAGSMADIAFLLLIFFLVTTTMDTDLGLPISLPPIPEEPPPDAPENKRNVLEILVNSRDELLVEGDLAQIEDLKEITKKFILNNGADPNLSDSPQDAIVSIKNDRGTHYDIYIQVQNELKSAYAEVRNNASMSKFGRLYNDLSTELKKEIKAIYPQKISEAEPEDIGGQN